VQSPSGTPVPARHGLANALLRILGALFHAQQEILGRDQAHAVLGVAQRLLRTANGSILFSAELNFAADRVLDELR
jgi:hypothetical protein